MVSVATSTAITKSLQLVLSVLVLGLSSKLLSNRSSLSSASAALSDHNLSKNGIGFNLTNPWEIEAAAVSSSAFTLVSSGFNYFYPTTAMTLLKGSASSISSDSSVSPHNFVSLTADEFANSSPLSVSAVHTSYLTSLVSSETLSNAFWFVNMIVQIADFASDDCSSVSDILDNYNLTGVSNSQSLYNYFNYFDNSSTSTVYNEIYEALALFNITNLGDIQITDLNGTTLQSDLLLSLSHDCQVKKASMALSILVWVTHILSSGLLTSELVSFWNKFSNAKTKALKLKDSELSKTNENKNEEGGEEETEEADKLENKASSHNVFLTFDHGWGLFNIILDTPAANDLES
ncbi:hypothetical protein PMKS-003903 [Pichia membranifaciens]|uniref:Uncharacterized protein n=1 Tax=Pichia membranifaciens TaxID=4926 RepID=A0A1Q2YLG8_9ASCO|nr:hypothetical protein PMKS-003903 [Pichia membranifaciens]